MTHLARVSTKLHARPSREDILRVIEDAWSEVTSSDPARWSPQNPAWGQCAVTALVIQDYLGGTILRGQMVDGSHYWNTLPDGEELDATIQQFPARPPFSIIVQRPREVILENPDTWRRYSTFAGRVRRNLGL